MKNRDRLPYILAILWGAFWAFFLQRHPFGRWLVIKRTWITVVIGVAVDGLLMLPLMPAGAWWRMVLIFVCSSFGIISRSLYNELTHDNDLIDAIKQG